MQSIIILMISILILLNQIKLGIECKVIHYSILSVHPGDFNIEVHFETENVLTTTSLHLVLIFFSGFGNTAPSQIYSQLLTKIIEQEGNDLIIIGLSQQRHFDPNIVADKIQVFFNFMNDSNKTRQFFLSEYPKVTFDIQNRLGVFSCGFGTPSITIYLNQQCGPVKFLVAMDPTNTLYGLFSGRATNTTLTNGHLTVSLPTLIIANNRANRPYSLGEILTGPCSLYNYGSERFYEVLSNSPNSPIFHINFTQYGLGDIYNRPLILGIKSLVCSTCLFHQQFECDYEEHQNNIAQLVAQFISALFNRKQTDLTLLQEANEYFKDVINKYQLNGYNANKQSGLCIHE